MPNSISIPHHVQLHASYTWHLTGTPDQLLYVLDHTWLKQNAHAVFAEATSKTVYPWKPQMLIS